MNFGSEVNDSMYLVAGGICAGCKKERKHLYKLTKDAESEPRCARCTEELKK